MKKKIIAFILPFLGLLFLSQAAYSQIIDDTTKLYYSPKTTLQLYAQDVLRGRYLEQPIDTSLSNLQNERFWYNDTSFYQHLGNTGTAAQPLFYYPPQKIGVRLGKNAFDRYAYDPYEINYFNTRSPYTHLFYVQGARGEQVFEGLHTRNITPRWNAGAAYQIITANQQIGPAAGDRRARSFLDNQAIKVFSHYRSENENYNLFFNFTFMRVEQVETGGIIPDTTFQDDVAAPSILSRFEEAPVQLTTALNQETRNNFHLMQIYRLAKENLKVYHVLDWRRQQNRFEDTTLTNYRTTIDSYLEASNGSLNNVFAIYPDYKLSRLRTIDITNYKELQNTFGLTGNYKLSSYNAYAKLRNATMVYNAQQSTPTDSSPTYVSVDKSDAYNQVLIGGDIRLMYKNLAELTGEAEYQLGSDYRVKGRARIGGAFATLERTLFSPSRVEDYMLSNHFLWENDFETSVTDRIGVGYAGAFGTRQFVKLNAHYTNIKRHIFFNESAEPQQLSGNQRLWGADLLHHIRFGPVHFKNLVAYTNTDEADKVRIPDFLLESTIYIEGFLFKQALFSQVGVQTTYMSSYYADAYMPVTQQFYVQDHFQVQGYPVVDVFLNADIKTVNLFVKMSHVNDQLLEPVYFVTPYYPGMRRSFTFGLKWMFFD
ncbi:putative porin [Pontibacter pamirensis]|uniref:putative porin n=1 Tax=Pontibacter pamirensis TaxID=2562824 RepID=UPI0013897D4A|nr:putative porin [Pontibacter pamirensis]